MRRLGLPLCHAHAHVVVLSGSANGVCTYTGPGTVSCACKTGYSGNGVTCKPVGMLRRSSPRFVFVSPHDVCLVDNCAAAVSPCSKFAVCATTGPATHKCTCNKGY